MRMILAHYDCKKDKKQSLDEHLWHVACSSRQEASIIGQGDVLFFNWSLPRPGQS